MNLVEKRLKKIKKQKQQKKKQLLLSNFVKLPENKFLVENPIDITEDLMEKIAALGLPFSKHQKDSGIYIKSYKRLRRKYAKHREQVLIAFKLAHEFFNNKDFIFKPQKISISEFIRFTSAYLRYNIYAKKFSENYKIVSLFDEFLKGRRYIEDNYLRRKIPRVDGELLDRLIKIWNCRNGEVEENQLIYFKKFIAIAESFCKLNSKVNIRSILIILENNILPKNKFHAPMLSSPIFWEEILPKTLVRIGIYRNIIQISKPEISD